jgi:hypothetical protein
MPSFVFKNQSVPSAKQKIPTTRPYPILRAINRLLVSKLIAISMFVLLVGSTAGTIRGGVKPYNL